MRAQVNIRKHLILFIVVISLLMFGLAFAMSPLYSWYCQVAGIKQSQSSDPAPLVSDKRDDLDYVKVGDDKAEVVPAREINVEFDATIHESLQGIVTEFRSLTPELKLKLGQIATLNYRVKNSGTTTLVTQAVPSITPWWGSEHLKKIECFCFQQQTLAPGEEKDMALRFYLDKDFPQDIQSLTLSYTLMKAKDGNDFSGLRK